MNKIQKSLLKIQEEAKKRVAKNLAEISQPEISAEGLAAIRDGLNGAVAKAIAVQAGREYSGVLAEKLMDLAYAKIRSLKSSRSSLKTSEELPTTIYPANCRYFSENKDRGVMIIEQPPQYRTIFIGNVYDDYYDDEDNDNDNDQIKTVRIPLPYLVFVVCFSKSSQRDGSIRYVAGSCGVGFRATPISSIEDHLYAPALPHCEVTGACLPAPSGPTTNISDLVEKYMESFWRSKFVHEFKNFSITVKGKKRNITSYEDWSNVDPLDMLSFNTANGGYSLHDLMQSRMGINNYSVERITEVTKMIEQVVSEISRSIDSTAISGIIQESTRKIVETSIKAAFPDSALQPK